MQTKLIKAILALQPIFPAPVYFSVLTGHPWLWLSVIIAILPVGVRLRSTRSIITRTMFDIPIIIFAFGTLLGLLVSPDKNVAIGALSSTFASVLVYYGITSNANASRKYWLWMASIICLITLLLSLWFFSQSYHRVLFFNQWTFNLFSGLPKTNGPVLNLHTIGALLVVVIPPLAVGGFLKYNINLRIIALILCIFFTGILFLSDSGTGWLAFIISITFILVCWRKRLLWVIIPLEGLFAGAAAIFYKKFNWVRITFSTSSLMARIELWQNTLDLLKGKAAIMGLGPGVWLRVYSNHYATTVAIVHNSYLQLYCDAGILGFAAMVLAAVIIVHFSLHLLKSPHRNSTNWMGIGLIGSIIAGAVFAIFDTTHSVTDVTNNGYIYLSIPLLWIVAALISVINDKLSIH